MKWTQEQAIAFESARECITALMAVYTAALSKEEGGPSPRPAVVEELNEKIANLFRERARLQPTDVEAVARVRTVYGPMVRAAMDAARQPHAVWRGSRSRAVPSSGSRAPEDFRDPNSTCAV